MAAPTRSELQNQLDRQIGFFRTGTLRDPSARVRSLKALRAEIVARRDDLLTALSEDLGKPLAESYMAEYVFTLQELDHTLKNLGKWTRRQRVSSPWYFWPARSWIEREAFGRVLIFGPWNYPFHLVVAPLISAIAAGNTVVLKPSEHSPKTSDLICEIVGAALPQEHVTVVTGEAGVAQELLECESEFIFFTGSTAVGRKVAESAARRLIPTVLELGGKCGCVVDKDADLAVAVDRVLLGKWMNAGQTCVAPDYLLVHSEVKEEFISLLEEAMRTHLEGWSGLARMVHADHYERILALCEGEQERVFGEDDREALFLAPRLLLDCDWQSRVMQSEIFGPVLPLLEFTEIEELMCQPAALATYIFGRDGKRINDLIQKLPSGGVCINDTMKQMTNLELPFGGVGASGHGRYRGKWGFEAFSYPRAFTKRYFTKDPFQILPPYEGAYERLQKLFK